MDDDLRRLIDAWPKLPDAIRAGIVATVAAAAGNAPSRRQNCVGFVTQQIWKRVCADRRQYKTELLAKGVDEFYRCMRVLGGMPTG